MQAESNLVKHVMLEYSKQGYRLFKNVRGMFLTKDGRDIKAGLMADGSSDLIGFKTVKITPEMVGTEIAQFCAVEVKTPSGRVRPEQIEFLRKINKFGGIGVLQRGSDCSSVSLFTTKTEV